MQTVSPERGPSIRTDALSVPLSVALDDVFGTLSDSVEAVAERAQRLLIGRPAIVWEGDAQTFAFSFVSSSAEQLLGYPAHRWTTEPAFWAETVVHPDDRDDAVAFCALATGKGRDHDFIYRANTADGRVVWLHDVVRVIRGASGIPATLRGVMIDVTEEMSQAS